MAQYWVKHKCGHEVIHHLQGRHDDRQRKVAFLEGTPCMECRGRAGAGVADAAGLPPLSGTARQIPWAEEIRGRLHTSGATADAMEEIRAVRDDGTRSTLMSIVDGIWATAEASWWIDHRQCGFRELVRRIDSEMASERIESAQLPPLSGTADQVAEA